MSRGVSERCLRIISSQQLLPWATPPSPTLLSPLGAWPTKPKLVSVQCVECKRGFWTLQGGFFFSTLLFISNICTSVSECVCKGKREREREYFFPLFFLPRPYYSSTKQTVSELSKPQLLMNLMPRPLARCTTLPA